MLPYRWIAIAVTFCGLVIVGVSGILNENAKEAKKTKAFLGETDADSASFPFSSSLSSSSSSVIVNPVHPQKKTSSVGETFFGIFHFHIEHISFHISFQILISTGMAMILGGQLVGAVQMVIEETFMKNKNFAPMHVVGMEGTFGIIFMALAVLPVLFFIPGDQVFLLFFFLLFFFFHFSFFIFSFCLEWTSSLQHI